MLFVIWRYSFQLYIENVTLLDLPLQGRDLDDVLVSGRTYREYLDEYDSEVATLSGEDEF